MNAIWDFLKRHRVKFIAGASFAFTLYTTKKVLETDLLADYLNSFRTRFCGDGGNEESTTDEGIIEARRQFLFDMHQRSCNKILNRLFPEICSKIDKKFNTFELLNKLKSTSELDPQQKIQLWHQLKVYSACKIISMTTVFPLMILFVKSQKSILCHLLCQSTHEFNQNINTRSSIFSNGIHYVKSLFYLVSNDNAHIAESNNSSTRNSTELFIHLIDYFQNDGIDLLLGVIEKVSTQVFEGINLSELLNSNDLLFSFERVRANLKDICGESNYTDFLIPNLEMVNLTNLRLDDNENFRIWIQYFIKVLNTQKSRQLMELFGGWYLEHVMRFIEEAMQESSSLPTAKMVPIFCNAFSQIAVTGHGSVFHSILSSTELHQFTLFVADECKSNNLFVANDSF